MLYLPLCRQLISAASVLAFLTLATHVGCAAAQGIGISVRGNTGGLSIPSAFVLESGTVAATAGNYLEPRLSPASRRQNYSFGIGLLPYVELFGRFAEYTTPVPGSDVPSGVRDISANIKVQLPPFWPAMPNLAVGLNDVSGGAVFFKSKYLVASDQVGPLRWSLGYARSSPILGDPARGYAFKGGFGGAELAVGATGLAALAEYDGQQKHAGLRYYSPRFASLGNAQLIGTLQRSFGAVNAVGAAADSNSFSVSLVLPLGQNAARSQAVKPDTAFVLPPLDAEPAAPLMKPTADDRLDTLQRALMAAGLERVRVGTLANNLVVEYENNRFGHNEADALGVVLGLAAEHAPPGLQRAYAITLKAGLRLYETSVDIPSYRIFLRDGDALNVRASLGFDRSPQYRAADVKWQHREPGFHSPLRVEVKPDFSYTLGTEIGAFDYSLAANVQGIVPLWRGGELYTSFIQRLSHSENIAPGRAFESALQKNGLKVASLQQSVWLNDRVFANLGVGRFNYNAFGVQAESTVFMSQGDDTVRLRAARYQHKAGAVFSPQPAYAAVYRWALSPTTWLEAGAQQYNDGSRGPAFAFRRWFGDVSAQLSVRKGGARTFAGLELSFPLSPRRGMDPGPLQLMGTSQFSQGFRTRLIRGGNSANFVDTNAVRDLGLDYNAEARHLNAGRVGPDYFASQLGRMREAFYLFGGEGRYR